MITAVSRNRKTTTITAVVIGLAMAFVSVSIAAEGPHTVESNILAKKMWPTTPSSEEVREGIEAALKIPDWQPRDGATTSW